MSEAHANTPQKKAPANTVNPAPTLADYILIAPTVVGGKITSLSLTRPGNGELTDCVHVDGADARRAWRLINSIFDGAKA